MLIVLDANSNLNECSDGIKRIAPSFVLDVILPSLDVYSDISLITGWYLNGHFDYAISMTVPILLQFLSTIYKWVNLEKRQNKKWSWSLLFLQFWPQWRAICTMRFDFKNDPKAEEKRKKLMREVTSTEPFLEAWPSIIIMTIIWLSTMGDYSFIDYCQLEVKYNQTTGEYNDKECNEYDGFNYQPPNYCMSHPEVNSCAVYGGIGGAPWFFTSFAISIITGSLGITKFLQVGPFSVLTSEGTLKGICKWRFFLCYMAVITSIFMKGLFIALFSNFALSSGYPFIENSLGTIEKSETAKAMFSLLGGLLILPNFLFSLLSIGWSTGFNKKLVQVILSYPAAWMLPITTYFVIGPHTSPCCSKTNSPTNQLGFSKSFTIINIILTVMMYALVNVFFAAHDNHGYLSNISAAYGLVLLLSLAFNFVFISLDEKFCCRRSKNCFCSCCCDYECYKHETYVIATNTEELYIEKVLD